MTKPQLSVVNPPKKKSRVTKAELLDEVEKLRHELDAEKEAKAPTETLATAMTGVMSAVIPLFGTVFSMVAGHCFQAGNPGLAVLGALAVLLSLSVSMPHLAHAIRILTKSSRRASVTLAVAFDLGVILAELGRVFGPQNLGVVLTSTLFALMALSGILNYIAFRTPEPEVEG